MLARQRSRNLPEAAYCSEIWPKVEPLLSDDDAEIAVSAASLALRLGDDANKTLAVRRLIEVLPVANWLSQSEIERLLLEHFSFARAAIQEAIQQQSANPTNHWPKDVVLRVLSNVVRRAACSN
jgi:hypothetical protein